MRYRVSNVGRFDVSRIPNFNDVSRPRVSCPPWHPRVFHACVKRKKRLGVSKYRFYSGFFVRRYCDELDSTINNYTKHFGRKYEGRLDSILKGRRTLFIRPDRSVPGIYHRVCRVQIISISSSSSSSCTWYIICLAQLLLSLLIVVVVVVIFYYF